MKKLIKNPLFTFILGAIICGTTGVIASNLMASNIAYTPKDKTWKVTNVEAAINDLYSKSGGSMLTQNIILNTTHTYQLPMFDGYAWVSVDNEALTVDSNGLVTVNTNGDIFLEKDNTRYARYNFEYRGPAIHFVSGKYGSYNNFRINDVNGITSSVATYLFDGIKTRQGTAGALMFIGDEQYDYIKFVVNRPCTITFSTGGYSDDGGNSSNRTVNFYKLNNNNEETLYTTFKTKVAIDYETKYFEAGTYILRGEGRYPEFDEWEIVEN